MARPARASARPAISDAGAEGAAAGFRHRRTSRAVPGADRAVSSRLRRRGTRRVHGRRRGARLVRGAPARRRCGPRRRCRRLQPRRLCRGAHQPRARLEAVRRSERHRTQRRVGVRGRGTGLASARGDRRSTGPFTARVAAARPRCARRWCAARRSGGRLGLHDQVLCAPALVSDTGTRRSRQSAVIARRHGTRGEARDRARSR